MVRDRKPKGFFYLDHRTVDSKFNIITDVFITPGNVNDVVPYSDRLDIQIQKFKFDMKYIGLDAGYYTAPLCKGIYDRGVQPVIATRLGPHKKDKYTINSFIYIEEWDVYACPNDYFLNYRTTTKQGYSEYVSNECDCKCCSKITKCLIGQNKKRTIKKTCLGRV